MPQLRGQFAPAIEAPGRSARTDLEADPAPPGAEPALQGTARGLRPCAWMRLKLATSQPTGWRRRSSTSGRPAGGSTARRSFSFRSARSSLPSTGYFLEPEPAAGPPNSFAKPGPDPATGLFHGGPDDRPLRTGSRFVLHPRKPQPVGAAAPRRCAARGLRPREGFHLDVAPRGAQPSLRAGLPHRPSTSPGPSRGPTPTRSCCSKLLAFSLGRWNIDRSRILLTGLSDGATYALKRSLDKETPFTHFAIFSGILAPFDLRHAKGRRIFWVHGAKDWMFPAWRAKMGEKELAAAGADVTLEIVPDLYHAYPRERNDRVLTLVRPFPRHFSPDRSAEGFRHGFFSLQRPVASMTAMPR
ncbi:MAG: hypothetical protein MZV70_75690 [Desulfobacterales bacterium]|nr:hypothetical protein [Desulfobacterales bacterium]